MTHKELHEKYGETKVGVIASKALNNFALWTPFNENLPLDEKIVYLPRYLAELDPSFRQPIPYILVRDMKGRYFATRRKAGDSRLTGKISLGIGGHVENAENIIGCAYRELYEEIKFSDNPLENKLPKMLSNLGLIVSSETEVDQVHMGFVLRLIADDTISINELDELEGFWFTVDEIREQFDWLESWSQILLINGVLDLPLDGNEIARGLAMQYIKKNADYKNSFHETHKRFGPTAGFVRINDKIERMASLESGVHNVKSESLLDTIGDAATYCLMQAAELCVHKKGEIVEDSQEGVLTFFSRFMGLEDMVLSPYKDASSAREELMLAYNRVAMNDDYDAIPFEESPVFIMLNMGLRFIITYTVRQPGCKESSPEKQGVTAA